MRQQWNTLSKALQSQVLFWLKKEKICCYFPLLVPAEPAGMEEENVTENTFVEPDETTGN